MMYRISVDSLPTLRDYKDAKQRYEETKPIRGSDNVRPLGHRRYGHTRYIREIKEGAAYACALYRTDCVSYLRPYTDEAGNVIEDIWLDVGGWHTDSTAAFMDAVLPYPLRVCRQNNAVRVNGIRIDKAGGMLIRRVNGGEWSVVNPTKEYVHTINRAGKKAVLKRYEDFLQWAKAMLSLVENKVGIQQSDTPPVWKGAIPLLSDPETYFTALQTIAMGMGMRLWHSGTNNAMYVLKYKGVEEAILRLHVVEVLTQRELAPGEVKRDRYASWL